MALTTSKSFEKFSVDDYINAQAHKTLSKVIVCGSVDDGKSSLIGRLLYETDSLSDSELAQLALDSKKFGTTNTKYDFALLLDGLASEREQGITIDVAYRYFSTNSRKFIIADPPGHEQYSANMVTAASQCHTAVLIIDASRGIQPQTHRHSYIVSMLGIKNIIVVINKMDLIDYQQATFNELSKRYLALSDELDFEKITMIPVCALTGCNLTKSSQQMRWYQGPSLLTQLEKMPLQDFINQDFVMSVQRVSRPSANFRGYAGRVSTGEIKPGDKVRVFPSGKSSTVKQIITMDGEQACAMAGDSITLTLADELDVARGNVLTLTDKPCEVADQFNVTLFWMNASPLVLSRQYQILIANQTAVATVTKLKSKLNIQSLSTEAGSELMYNDFGNCELSLNKFIPFKPYLENRELGGFILIDKITHNTVACGLINFSLRRSGNIYQQAEIISQQERSAIKGHKPKVIWLTGLSGSGKSTIANELEKQLNSQHQHTMLLDGDNIRHGLCKDLGFTEQQRAENIRRVAEVAKLMLNAGLVTIVAFISPFEAERKMARELIGSDNFIEVFIDVPLAVAETRDPKGLYKKARAGAIKNFTGISSPYQKPSNAELTIDSCQISVLHAVDMIIKLLFKG